MYHGCTSIASVKKLALASSTWYSSVVSDAKERRERSRRNAILKLGGCCSNCGTMDHRVLEFDHIDPRGGRIDRKTLGISQDKLLRIISKGNVDNVQLLCASCHRIKTRENA